MEIQAIIGETKEKLLFEKNQKHDHKTCSGKQCNASKTLV